MTFKEILQQGASVFATGIGFIVTNVMLFDRFEMLPFVLAGITPLTGGVLAFRHFRKQYLLRLDHEDERKMLELLALNKSNLSIAQLAMFTKIPVDRIEDVMDKLQKQGVIEIGTTEGGSIVYHLPTQYFSDRETNSLLSNSF